MSFSLKQLKIFQAEIFAQCSKSKYQNSLIYFKHLDLNSSSEADEIYEEKFSHAKNEGLEDLGSKLKELETEGSWTNKDISKLNDEKSFLSNLKVTKSKMHLKSAVDGIKYQIAQSEKTIADLEERRDRLVGMTAENYANRKANLYLTYISAYKDKTMSCPLFSYDEFQDLGDEQATDLFFSFNATLGKFSTYNLKKIALLPSYLNSFFLCQDNPYTFYGKPICSLSFYQTETFSNARQYKRIMEETNNNIPEDVMQDPEKLVEWFETNKNAEKLLSKYDDKDNMNISLVGATKEDMENLNMGSSGKNVDFAKEALKRGGTLSMVQMLELQGL